MAKKARKKSAAKSKKKSKAAPRKKAKAAAKKSKAAAKKKTVRKAKPAAKSPSIADRVASAYHTVIDTVTGTDTLRNKYEKPGTSKSE